MIVAMYHRYLLLIAIVGLVCSTKSGICGTTTDVNTEATQILDGILQNIDTIIIVADNAQMTEIEQRRNTINKHWLFFLERFNEIPRGENDNLDSIVLRISDNLEPAQVYSDKIVTLFEDMRHSLKELISELRKPMLIDFTGPRCKTCKVMKKRLEKISQEFKKNVRIVFVDVNKQKELAKKYRIMLLPTLVYCDKTYKEVYRSIGESEEQAIRVNLENLTKE